MKSWFEGLNPMNPTAIAVGFITAVLMLVVIYYLMKIFKPRKPEMIASNKPKRTPSVEKGRRSQNLPTSTSSRKRRDHVKDSKKGYGRNGYNKRPKTQRDRRHDDDDHDDDNNDDLLGSIVETLEESTGDEREGCQETTFSSPVAEIKEDSPPYDPPPSCNSDSSDYGGGSDDFNSGD